MNEGDLCQTVITSPEITHTFPLSHAPHLCAFPRRVDEGSFDVGCFLGALQAKSSIVMDTISFSTTVCHPWTFYKSVCMLENISSPLSSHISLCRSTGACWCQVSAQILCLLLLFYPECSWLWIKALFIGFYHLSLNHLDTSQLCGTVLHGFNCSSFYFQELYSCFQQNPKKSFHQTGNASCCGTMSSFIWSLWWVS